MRTGWLIACVVLAACPNAVPPKSPAPVGKAPAVDFTGWRQWPVTTSERLWSRAHGKKYVQVHVEPEHIEGYRAGAVMPQGARIAKAVYADAAGTRFVGVQAMAKMAPGYDADDRDWYYAALAADGVTVNSQGRISMCINCHIQAEDRDYLFRPQGRGWWTDGWQGDDAR